MSLLDSEPRPTAVNLRGPDWALGARTAPWLERSVSVLLGLFIFAQCFGMPLVGVGPWALWPTLADLALWGALGFAVLYTAPVQDELRGLWFLLGLVGALSLLAALLLFVMRDGHLGAALPFALFQLFKTVQLLAAFWMTARLPLGAPLLRLWERAASVSFLVMVVTVVWTYFSSAIPDFLGVFLPHGAGVSGPWEAYYRHNEHGLGTLGYNHAHVAAIVLLQGAFLMMLRPDRPHTWILFAVVFASFLSGARAGLVGVLLFVLLEGLTTPLRSTLAVLLLGVAGAFAMPYLHADLASLIDRQATILEAGDSRNLAGRGEIWQVYLGHLMHDPFRWLLGSGMGSGVANNGSNAHMLPLQILYETGLVGLTMFGLLLWQVLGRLRATGTARARTGFHLMLGLLVTSFAAETLYPNSAFGTFLPLLALVLAVALTPQAGGGGREPAVPGSSAAVK